MGKTVNTDTVLEWVQSWLTKDKYYHPYSKQATIPISELYDILEQMPSATCGNLEKPEKPQHSEDEAADCNLDCISRQDAIDALCSECQGNCIPCDSFPCGEVEAIQRVPSAQPDLDEWCTDCSEYDHERHCCPRWNRVIREAVKEAQHKPQWIPVTERLPEKDTFVLISDEDGDVYNAYYTYEEYEENPEVEWWSNDWKVYPVAWMPLPASYKGEEHD